MRHRRDEEGSVGGGGGAADGFVHFYAAEELLFFGGGEDREGAAAGAEVDLAVGNERRGPDFAAELVGPVGLAGSGVNAVEDARTVVGEDQAVVHRGRAAGFL